MKTQRNRLIVLLFVMTFMACACPAMAYPPDNAAVLYYKAFMLYEAEDEIKSMLDDYRQGRIELNERIEGYLAKNQRVIDMVLDATGIEKCDWGLDYSQGTEVLLPPHHEARDICFLITTEATMQADKGHQRQALGRCVSMYKMARHLNERPLLCYLIGIAINAASANTMRRVMSEMPEDAETLTWLRDELAEYNKQPYSIDHVLRWKREAGQISMSPDKITNAVQAGLDDGDSKTKILERIRAADRQFYTDNIAYWNAFVDRLQAAFAMPYAQAYAELEALDKKPGAEFDTHPEATLTPCFSGAFLRVYGLSMRWQSDWNANRAAVEVYLSKTRTGRLPETLPPGLPHDPYSGKPFAYEKTAEGFTLRCQGKDLDRDKAYEYEFKIAQ